MTEHRTTVDWAHCIQDLIDVHYPDAERIDLLSDNLNTHSPASLYAALEPAEAKHLTDKLEMHYTQKHGSWFNAAEIELAILSKQCLDWRISDRDTLRAQVGAGDETRNKSGTGVDWRFTSADARIKLKHLYPRYEARPV